MYQNQKKELILWCDGKAHVEEQSDEPITKKAKTSDGRHDQKVDDTFKELQKNHSETFSVPLLRLWARVHVNGLHESLIEPPDLPQFKNTKKTSKSQMDSMSPCKVADTRGSQLHELKSLLENGILNNNEYEEQKAIILSSLRKLQ